MSIRASSAGLRAMRDACYVMSDGIVLKSDLLLEIDSGKVEDVAG